MPTPIATGTGGTGGDKASWFANTKTKLTRENLDRAYYSASDHIWMGMNDVWWAVTHPHKAIPRNIGQLAMVTVVAAAIGTFGYIFFGTPGSAQVNLEEPGSFWKVASDYTVRPIADGFVRVVGAISGSDSDGGSDENSDEYDGQDYRR